MKTFPKLLLPARGSVWVEKPSPDDQLAALSERHGIHPIGYDGRPVHSGFDFEAHPVCASDRIPVYQVRGGYWRHDRSAIRALRERATPRW